jgi:hypothetical protein
MNLLTRIYEGSDVLGLSDLDMGEYREITADGKIQTFYKNGTSKINGYVKEVGNKEIFVINGYYFTDLSSFDVRKDYRKGN